MKFCIAPQHRSNGYGRQLLSAGLSKAKENDIMRVTLQSNSNLQAAIEMYQRFGFAFTSVEDRGYQSADVQMEIILKAH